VTEFRLVLPVLSLACLPDLVGDMLVYTREIQ